MFTGVVLRIGNWTSQKQSLPWVWLSIIVRFFIRDVHLHSPKVVLEAIDGDSSIPGTRGHLSRHCLMLAILVTQINRQATKNLVNSNIFLQKPLNTLRKASETLQKTHKTLKFLCHKTSQVTDADNKVRELKKPWQACFGLFKVHGQTFGVHDKEIVETVHDKKPSEVRWVFYCWAFCRPIATFSAQKGVATIRQRGWVWRIAWRLDF